jgi:DNA-binding NarL/FixJ family response regulator
VVVTCFPIADLENRMGQEEGGLLTRSNTAEAMPRVFLADDRKEVLQAVALVLEDEFEIVGTAGDGMVVLELVPYVRADVLVLDISMPILNGIEVAWHLKNAGSAARIVFLTIHEDGDFVRAAMTTGAFGYVLKSCLASDLAPAIRKALEGETFISPAIDLG